MDEDLDEESPKTDDRRQHSLDEESSSEDDSESESSDSDGSSSYESVTNLSTSKQQVDSTATFDAEEYERISEPRRTKTVI